MRRVVFLLIFLSTIFFGQPLSYSYNFIQVGNSIGTEHPLPSVNNHSNINGNGQAVWQAGTDGSLNHYEIFFFDGASTIQLTNNNFMDLDPQINDNGWVVWQGGGQDFTQKYLREIYLYNGSQTLRLTNDNFEDTDARINAHGQVVWRKKEGQYYHIYFYDGTITHQITGDNYDALQPDINDNGHLVWLKNVEGFSRMVMFYNGNSITQVPNIGDFHFCFRPRINNNDQVVWAGSEVNGAVNQEIFLYTNGTVIRLTNNSYADVLPQINENGYITWNGNGTIKLYDGSSTIDLGLDPAGFGSNINSNGKIIWCSSAGIRLYDGSNTIHLTDNPRDLSPDIGDNNDVVFDRTSDMTHQAIWLAKANRPPVLNPIGNKTVRVGKRLRFTITANDPDEDDNLHFAAQNLPQGASFIDNGNRTATFDWTPTVNQAGLHSVLFQVSDGDLSDSEPITINVYALQVATAVPLP